MALKSGSFLSMILLITVLSFVLNEASLSLTHPPSLSPTAGGWQPIPDVNDPEVVRVGSFAVQQYNKNLTSTEIHLKFITVVRGWVQVVAGMNYCMVISAAVGEADPQNFTAEVFTKPWKNITELHSFKKGSK